MLIVIPTYKRNYCLKWVLQSLVQCRTGNIPEQIRVLVVNNYPPARDKIKSIVSSFSHEKRFAWDILYREKTLPSTENFYSAIQENALPNEVVLLHGDDDIFCPWSIEDRYQAILSLNADVLLSRSSNRIIFLPDGKSAILYGSSLPKRKLDVSAKEALLSDSIIGGGVFIGNHCYRNTETWKNALSLSFDWCHKQDWLDWNTRTLMLPYYLPFAVSLLGGKLGGLDQICVIRGGDLLEITKSPYGSPGWNSGFLALCAYGVFTSTPLKEISDLDSERRALINMAARWRLTMYFDCRIPANMRKETFRRIKIPLTIHSILQSIMGIRLLIGEYFQLRGWIFRLNSRKCALHLQEFLQSLIGRS